MQSIKAQYWDPMWRSSYLKDDCEVDKVMDGLNIDRDAANKLEMTKYQWEQAKERMRAHECIPKKSPFHAKTKTLSGSREEDDSESDGSVSDGED